MTRRLLPLLALAALGCGGSGGGNGSPRPILSASPGRGPAFGLNGRGEPAFLVQADYGARPWYISPSVATPIPQPPSAMLVAGDWAVVLTYTAKGTYVYNARTKASRWIATGEPLRADGGKLLLKVDGKLAVEDLDAGTRTTLPIVLEQFDEPLDFRNGRLLIRRFLPPTPSAYEVVSLDGTLLATLTVPAGIAYMNPVALNANGEVAGTSTRPGAIILVDSEPYPVRWSASGVPTFVHSDAPVAVAGITDDGGIVVGPIYRAGTMRLLKDGLSTDLKVRVTGWQTARVEGRTLFVEQFYPDTLAAYRIP